MTGAAHAAPTDARTAWRTAWGAPARWAKRRWDAPITQCARLLPEACPRLTAALVVLILANAVIPAATIVATGLMIGSLSATVHAGLASPAGHRTLATLGAWAALMMLGEMEPRLLTAAAASAASRVESRVQERVIAALNRPWSIAHLESPRTADLLSQVSGLGVGAVGPGLAVSGLVTSRIPMILRSLVSGALLLVYSWPLALLLAAVQVFFVRQIRRGWVADAQNLLGKTDAVRRADYYRDLALGAGTAKEMRVLGPRRLAGRAAAARVDDQPHAAVEGAPVECARRRRGCDRRGPGRARRLRRAGARRGERRHHHRRAGHLSARRPGDRRLGRSATPTTRSSTAARRCRRCASWRR